MKILTDKECKAIWEATDAKSRLKLDDRGLQVMKWLERDLQASLTKDKVWNWKSGIN